MRILSSAQQTADNYVAEAEEFSRQVTSEARAEYEEQIRRGAGERRRDHPGGPGGGREDRRRRRRAGPTSGRAGSVEELEEQVAYLKAFGQACRAQLRSYLEALLSDVETEWGRADPAALPMSAPRPPAQRAAGPGPAATFSGNSAVEQPADAADVDQPASAGAPSSS